MKISYQAGSVSIVFLKHKEQIEALHAIFLDVAEEYGWKSGNQLAAFIDRSAHIAIFKDNVLAGGLQIVWPQNDKRMPFHHVWPELECAPLINTAHVTILALTPSHRGHFGLFLPLCIEVWRFCMYAKIETLVLETTPPMLRLYRRLGWPLEVIGDLRVHWGEPCYLCKLGLKNVAGNLLRKAVFSPVYRALAHQATRPYGMVDCTALVSLP